ncbi:MAG TPA: DNA polymerase/3'-5' exonuclease PolX [Candidatus Eisenbacteria bacterium]
MDKRAVADILERIGTLLELKGENVFKTRAYQNGARALMALEEDLAVLVAENRLKDVKGIGAALCEKITLLVTTGRLEYYEKLKAEFPDGFEELLRVPGFGPKKAMLVMTELKIATLDELEAAARAGSLAALPGFGAKTEQKILEGIEHVRKHAGRFLANVAESEANLLLAAIRDLPGVERVSLAGSLRRRLETSKDIDIVVAAREAAPIMAAFTSAPNVAAVTGHGETKSSVRLASGMAADLRCVTPEEFPFALMYFTGSKAHNVAMRGRAQKMGWRLNEYALEKNDKPGVMKPCADEAAIYEALGLRYIEPELREDTGELAASEAGTLPRLITDADIRGLLHQHTDWSDGQDTLDEMVRTAAGIGLEFFGITDHSQTAGYARGLSPERVRKQHHAIEALQAVYAGKLRIFKGIESDILPDGRLDYDEETLALFDYLVASVHSSFQLSEADQTARIVRAVSHPKVRILGHPTGRLLLARDPYAVNLSHVFAACAANEVAVEINASPHRLDLDWREIRAAKEAGCRFSINPDAHNTHGLAEERFGVGVARKGWLTAADVINTWDADAIERFLRRGQV